MWKSLVVVAAIVLGQGAFAQAAPGKKPTQKELDEARKHFRDAEAAKARGDYRTAAVDYLAAYELFQEPEFFFDVADAYRLAGDEKSALTYYEKYLELDSSGRGVAVARAAAAELRRSIAAKEDAARRDQEAAAEQARKDAEAEAARKAAAQQHDTEGPQVPPIPSPGHEDRPDRPGRNLRIAGLATGGAGVLAIGIGIYFGIQASSISNEAASWDRFDPDRYEQGQAAQRNMFIFTGVGAAAVIGGGVLYYLGHRAARRARDTQTVILVPSVGPSDIRVSATVHF